MKPEIRVGSVVYLNSGGVRMTVCDVRNLMVTCRWCDAYDVPHEMDVSVDAVTLAPTLIPEDHAGER